MKQLKTINDLFRHNQPLNLQITGVFNDFIASGWYVLGKQVDFFEKAFADYCGVSYAIGVANGTEALEIALRAVGITAGNKVALVANAGCYGTMAVNAIEALPVYVDIDLATLTMDVASLENILAHNTIQAIIVTHLYGQLANIEKIKEVADQYQIKLIEDCAQAHGAIRGGIKAGAFGDIACFSFYPTKNLGALGDGGAIITNNNAIATRVKQLRQYGWDKKYTASVIHGRNSRLDELQAAILNVKLPHLNKWNKRRNEIAALYNANINHPYITKPLISKGEYVAHLYVLRVKERDIFSCYLTQAEVPHDIHYPVPDYKQPMFNDLYAEIFLPITEQVSKEIFTLPCFPEMTDEEVLWVSSVINQWEP